MNLAIPNQLLTQIWQQKKNKLINNAKRPLEYYYTSYLESVSVSVTPYISPTSASTTVHLAFLTIYRYILNMQYQKLRGKIRPSLNLFTSGQIYPLAIEVFFVMLIPYPWLEGTHGKFRNVWLIFLGQNYTTTTLYGDITIKYHVNAIVQFFSALRIIVVIRSILVLTYWGGGRAQRIWYFFCKDSSFNLCVVAIFMEETHPFSSHSDALWEPILRNSSFMPTSSACPTSLTCWWLQKAQPWTLMVIRWNSRFWIPFGTSLSQLQRVKFWLLQLR